MILFYSEFCQHCSVLIETIKRHDTKKSIKLVSIDLLRSLNKPIDKKIHSVPSLMFLPSKELIFGKAVFDYLLLPNRGFLFTNNSTRTDKTVDTNSSINSPIPLNNTEDININDPVAFSLGGILSDKFSSISDDDNNSMNINSDKIYNWTSINNKEPDNNNNETTIKYNEYTKKQMPSLEEITKQRELQLT